MPIACSQRSELMQLNLPVALNSTPDMRTYSTKFSELPIGLIIRYSKVSKRVRKYARGRIRYKARLDIVGAIASPGVM